MYFDSDESRLLYSEITRQYVGLRPRISVEYHLTLSLRHCHILFRTWFPMAYINNVYGIRSMLSALPVYHPRGGVWLATNPEYLLKELN